MDIPSRKFLRGFLRAPFSKKLNNMIKLSPPKNLKRLPKCHTLTPVQRQSFEKLHKNLPKFLSTQDIIALQGVCKQTARRISSKIRKLFGADCSTTKVSLKHYSKYFGLHTTDIAHYLENFKR